MDGRLHHYAAELVGVVDGDTIDVKLDLGFAMHMDPFRTRLARINAFEMKSPGGPEAKAALQGLLAGKVLVVSPLARWKDKYGRFLCEVEAFVPDPSGKDADPSGPVNLSDWMVAEGHAVWFMCSEAGNKSFGPRGDVEAQLREFVY